MSDLPQSPSGHQESIALLQSYGLDVLLTAEDDPRLWAAVLRQHWPVPDDRSCDAQALRFGIGRRMREGEDRSDPTLSVHAGSRGMVEIEEWGFERIDAGRLRVVRCEPQAASNPLWNMISLVDRLQGMPPGSLPATLPQCISRLDLSRPSQGVHEAMVHSATISGPLAGSGAATMWRRRDDGSWAQTGEVLALWIN